MSRDRNKNDDGNDRARMEDMQETIILLEEEIKRLSEPPYTAGTVLQLGEKTVQVVMEGGSCVEITMPNGEGLKKDFMKHFRQGSRVILNGNGAIAGYSEFSMPVGGEITVVDEINDGRIKVRVRGEPRMVLNNIKDIKVGDEVQLDRYGMMVAEKFGRRKTRYALEKVPYAPWSNIGGLEQTICEIREEIEDPFLHRKIFERYGREPVSGIFLYGPPGCGKTMIAKSIAYNLAKIVGNGAGHFISVKGPEILDKFVGNSEANIRRIYAAARDEAEESSVPTIVFIDEAESILKTRGSGISTDVYDSIVPQLLAEMNGMDGDHNVITVLATNRPDMIDPAALRHERMDRLIRVPRPNREGARQIFGIYLKDKPLHGVVTSAEKLVGEAVERIYDEDGIAYSVLSHEGNLVGHFGYQNLISGAMIKGIVNRACGFAIGREKRGGKKGLTGEDLHLALDEEFGENLGFAQSLIKDDWEDVFGSKGKQYYDLHRHGYLFLEKPDGNEMGEVKR